MNYLSEQQRQMVEATLFNMICHDGGILNRNAFRNYVGSLTDRELEQEVNEYMHGIQRVARAS